VLEYDDSPTQWLNTSKNNTTLKHSIILEDDGDSCDDSEKGS